ncbi:MAG TPA: YbaK/EbsC family protein [Humidesulfovibrio sp.]|uniref:aminoacyl-tRNA deacylase n=1 Tax=Humidesulfovibrio sp. TaxID=2910988 RepID=UPI002CA91783|nr:YbaK/EbsC family protein [Humidesulfovibrio sp.]HWR04348.1 YbaK/EbsC family protein [Humidesulfovibrio sp.]
MAAHSTAGSPHADFSTLLERVRSSGFSFVLHEHEATRTIGEAEANLAFDVARIVKTIAFATRDGRLVLAALRGTLRVDYAKLARLAGVSRKDLAPLSPRDVLARIGVAPGGVSPLHGQGHGLVDGEVLLFVDEDVLAIAPTLYCGTGRPDRTLEMAPADLLALCGGRLGAFSR